MRYIIFGGSGFVGRYAVAALQEAMASSRIEKGEIVCVDVAEFVGLDSCHIERNEISQNKRDISAMPQYDNIKDSSPISQAQNDKFVDSSFASQTQNDKVGVNSTPNSNENSQKFTQIPIKFVHCDISQDFDFAFEKDDIVVHLAARAYAPKPPLKPFGVHRLKEYFFAVNVEGTKRIVAQMLRDGCKRLVYFSTDMVYGKPQALPVPTSHERKPFGYYGLSKKASEDFIIAQRKIVAGGGGDLMLPFSAHE